MLIYKPLILHKRSREQLTTDKTSAIMAALVNAGIEHVIQKGQRVTKKKEEKEEELFSTSTGKRRHR